MKIRYVNYYRTYLNRFILYSLDELDSSSILIKDPTPPDVGLGFLNIYKEAGDNVGLEITLD